MDSEHASELDELKFGGVAQDMKIEVKIHRDQPKVTITLTRDSVCAADDADAPHEKSVRIHSFVDPLVLAGETYTGYFPHVNGTDHHWICILNGNRIATIEGRGKITPLVPEIVYQTVNRIHFLYMSALS